MRLRRPHQPGPGAALRGGMLLSLMLGGVLAGPVRAQDAPPAPVRIVPRQVGPLAAAAWDSLNLARATALWVRGDLPAAAARLETIATGPDASFAQADRAAFLLAIISLKLDDHAGFRRMVRTGDAAAASPYRRWLAYAGLLVAPGATDVPTDAPRDFWQLPGTAELLAAQLLAADQPAAAAALLAAHDPARELAATHHYLRALAAERSGTGAADAWQALTEVAPADAAGADLVATAWLALARHAAAAGRDPAPVLARVPGAGPAGARARQLQARLALAAGDTATARSLLTGAATPAVAGAEGRAFRLTAGRLASVQGDWAEVLGHLDAAQTDWDNEAAWLGELAVDPAAAAAVWRQWSGPGGRADRIPLPDIAWPAALDEVAAAAVDLTREPERFGAPAVAPGAARPAAAMTYARSNLPDGRAWRALDAVASERSAAASARGRLSRELARLEAEHAGRLAYLDRGRRLASIRQNELTLALADLDGLLARLDLALADLDRTRGTALAQYAERVADLAAELQTTLLFTRAVHRFHASGPGAGRPAGWPAEVPTPADLLQREEMLSSEIIAFLDLFAARVPDLVDRSCREVWVPRLEDDGPVLRAELAAARRQAGQLSAAIDAEAIALPVAREITATRDRLAAQTMRCDSLTAAEAQLRSAIVADVAARGEARLAAEREGLDYNRADALYWLAVAEKADPSDEAARARVRTAGDRARAALQTYLERHPAGRARAETRYRLADLELLRARDDFQTRMAGFLGRDPDGADLQNNALAPFVDYAPAIAQYRTILAEDPDFPHRAAVLFQLGMILGDAGDPASAAVLAELLETYPDAPYAQEASLAIGERLFAARDYDACRARFAVAAAGGDPDLQAIALYKLGWAHFERDEFTAAATAFGRLLDLDAAGSPAVGARGGTDLGDEAREYLVHALIRAGGASAYTAHFAQVGPRAYESSILLAMAHQLSGVSLYPEAIACDRLWLARFGDRDEALGVAERLVASHERTHRTEAAQEVRLELAERFLPGGAWVTARTDTALTGRADAFARNAFAASAVRRHEAARASREPAAWQAALAGYDAYLAHWPDAAGAARMHLQAGEAAHELGRYATALAHYRSAAAAPPSPAADDADLRREAAWQVAAVSDAWYRAAAAAGAATGPDSLARRLLAAAAEFQRSHPGDEHDGDLSWRRGQVAYAHGWYDEAATILTGLADDHPDDPHALAALRLSGDARYRAADYRAAGAAYERTVAAAAAAGADSVVAVVAPTIPLSYYRHAENLAAADSLRGPVAAAPHFATVAGRWPGFEHADLAWYRAGLGYETGGEVAAAVAAWEALLAGHPTSAYARDSALRIAAAHEAANAPVAAAAAYERFATTFTADPDAPAAQLKAADLLLAAGDIPAAEALKTAFLTRFPDESAAVLAIREERAARALAELGDDRSPDTSAEIRAYLALADAAPDEASPVLLSGIAYHKARWAQARYTALPLTQPLPASIAAKQQQLEEVLALFAACARYGVTTDTRAAAFHIGEAIIHFGDALLASERPAELQGDDLLAYEDVLSEQSWPFFDRGEAAWTELLEQSVDATDDPDGWLAATRQALWPRVARRFMHMPEADYPLVAAAPPPRGANLKD